MDAHIGGRSGELRLAGNRSADEGERKRGGTDQRVERKRIHGRRQKGCGKNTSEDCGSWKQFHDT